MGRAGRKQMDPLHELREEGLPDAWHQYWRGRRSHDGLLTETLLPLTARERARELALQGDGRFLEVYRAALPDGHGQGEVAADPLLDTWLDRVDTSWQLDASWRSYIREELAETLIEGRDWNLAGAVLRYANSQKIIEAAQQSAEAMSAEEAAAFAEDLLRNSLPHDLRAALLLSDNPQIWPFGGGQLEGFVEKVYQYHRLPESSQERLERMSQDLSVQAPIVTTFPDENYILSSIGPFHLRAAEVSAHQLYYFMSGEKAEEQKNLSEGLFSSLESLIGHDRVAAREIFSSAIVSDRDWQEFQENFDRALQTNYPAAIVHACMMRASYIFNDGETLPAALLRAARELDRPASPLLSAISSLDFANEVRCKTGMRSIDELRRFSLGELQSLFPDRQEEIDFLIDSCHLRLRLI